MKYSKNTIYTIAVKPLGSNVYKCGHGGQSYFGSNYDQLVKQLLDDLFCQIPKDFLSVDLKLNVSFSPVTYHNRIDFTAEVLANRAGKRSDEYEVFKEEAINLLQTKGVTPDSPYYQLVIGESTELSCTIVKEVEKGGLDD